MFASQKSNLFVYFLTYKHNLFIDAYKSLICHQLRQQAEKCVSPKISENQCASPWQLLKSIAKGHNQTKQNLSKPIYQKHNS